jgi:hypothetical protein
MEIVDHAITEAKPKPRRRTRGWRLNLTPDGELWHRLVQTSRNVFQPNQFTRVQIASPSGLRIFGVLRSVARSGIQVLTTVSVPVHCLLEITLEGCQPTSGEAFYSILRSPAFQTGIVFSTRQEPSVAGGSRATIRDLDPPFTEWCGSVLDIGSTSLSVLCKAEIAPGAWVRVQSSGWILFGVVEDVGRASTEGRSVQIHLEAAYPAVSTTRERVGETHFHRSFPALEHCALMDREDQLQGDLS